MKIFSFIIQNTKFHLIREVFLGIGTIDLLICANPPIFCFLIENATHSLNVIFEVIENKIDGSLDDQPVGLTLKRLIKHLSEMIWNCPLILVQSYNCELHRIYIMK